MEIDDKLRQEVGDKLEELLRLYVEAKVEQSWRGSRPMNEWDSIDYNEASTRINLTTFISNALGLQVNL